MRSLIFRFLLIAGLFFGGFGLSACSSSVEVESDDHGEEVEIEYR